MTLADVMLFLAVMAVFIPIVYASGVVPRAVDWLRRQDMVTRIVVVLVFGVLAVQGSGKGPAVVRGVLRMLFWDHPLTWPLSDAYLKTQSAVAANQITESALEEVEAVSNEVVTLSFDWHAPNRLPYHERQNVLAWTATVVPTNIEGTLYEDHYVAFNSTASTNPAVILIEYAGRREDGSIERYSAPVVTNSYPDTSVVTLQSGAYTCYWFRVAVPAAFTNSVRDWNGEVLFGSPHGSGKGFDLLGTLVIDADGELWVGATTNHVIGGVEHEFVNGIDVTQTGE